MIDGSNRLTTWTRLLTNAFLAALVVVVAAIVARHIYLRVAPEAYAGMEAVRDTDAALSICAPGGQPQSLPRSAASSDNAFLRRVCLDA